MTPPTATCLIRLQQGSAAGGRPQRRVCTAAILERVCRFGVISLGGDRGRGPVYVRYAPESESKIRVTAIDPCPTVPIPMDHGGWDSPEGAGSGHSQKPKGLAGSSGYPPILARPSGRLYGTAMFVPGAKIHSPLPADPIPEASQRVGMGPQNQARRLPPDGPKGRQPRQALHPSRL